MQVPASNTRRVPLSIVLPARNEAANLEYVIRGLVRVLAAEPIQLEFIVVDDGSPGSAMRQTAQLLQREFASLRYVRLARHFGKEAAIAAGLERATGAVVVTMDADGQHPPEVIREFLRLWRDGAAVVVAVPRRSDGSALRRRLGTLYHALLQSAAGTDTPIIASDYRLLDRRVVDVLTSLPERHRYGRALCAWIGFEPTTVEYTPSPRRSGRSRFGPLSLAGLAITGLTSFSVLPLRLIGSMGIALALASVAFGSVLVVWGHWTGDGVPTWLPWIVGGAFLSALHLVALGIVAEYVGRVFEEVKGRPIYVVSDDRSIRDQPHARLERSVRDDQGAEARVPSWIYDESRVS